MRTLFTGLFLSIVLLLTQQGALLHELSHLTPPHGHGHAQQQHGEHDHPGKGASPCTACLVLSHAGLGATPSVAAPPLLDHLAHALAAAAAWQWVSLQAPAARSRGPPHRL